VPREDRSGIRAKSIIPCFNENEITKSASDNISVKGKI